MKTIILFLILLSFSEAKTLKIATYNVENLFDMELSGLEYKEYIPNHHNWTEPMLTKKINHIAEVICDLDADVIGLQEVENDAVLARLQRTLHRVGCKYGYRAITNSKKTPIHNAILSKVPIKKRRDVVIFRNGKHRSILEVELKTDTPLRLFVNHWKSKQGPESQRLPYAKALVRRLEKLPKGTEYLLLGDFNSDYNEAQTISKKHNDTNGLTGINQILGTTKDGRLVRLQSLNGGGLRHYNLWLELASGDRWSHNFFGSKEALDALIIPAWLHNGAGWEYQLDSFTVFRPKYLFAKRGRINRWEYKHSKHTGKGYSDHLPVYALFSTQPSSEATSKTKSSFWSNLASIFSFTKKQEEPKRAESIRSVSSIPKTATIEDVILAKTLRDPVILKDAIVVWRDKSVAVIKQDPKGRAILLYGCAASMKAGISYDLIAYKKKNYKGIEELVDIEIERQVGTVDVEKFVHSFSSGIMNDDKYINEVVGEFEGIYTKGNIEIAGEKYHLYFKKRVKRPSEGSRIRIKRAIIGYYKKHNELVVWSNKDYQILE